MIISSSSVMPFLFSSFTISNIIVLPIILNDLNSKLMHIRNHNIKLNHNKFEVLKNVSLNL